MFDVYTKNILFEALGSSPTKVSGKTKKKQPKKLKSYGIGSPGPSGVTEVSPVKASPSEILYGTHTKNLPAGTDFEQQATWGFYKNAISSFLDGISYGGIAASGIQATGNIVDKLTGSNVGSAIAAAAAPVAKIATPAIEFEAKQKIKTILAQQYLGMTGGVLTDTGDMASKVAMTFHTALQTGVPGFNLLKKNFTGNQRFGKLGLKIAEKLPSLAAMGIDPLDWSTKMMGADDALATYANLANEPRKAALGAGGYLVKGIKQGIY